MSLLQNIRLLHKIHTLVFIIQILNIIPCLYTYNIDYFYLKVYIKSFKKIMYKIL